MGRRLALLPLALCCGCVADPEPHPRFRMTYFPAAVEGDVRITQGGTPGSGTRLELVDDLDMNGEEQFELAAGVEIGAGRLDLAWLPLHFDGEERLDQDEVFRGTLFPAGDRVESDLSLETWRLRLDAALLASGEGELRFGAGAYWWQLELKMHDLDTGVLEEREFSRLLPALTVAGSLKARRALSADFEAAVAAIDEGRYLVDLAGLLKTSFWRGFSGSVGWRWIRYALAEDTNDGTIDVFGPTFSLDWRF
jgi:hypothetical protein